MNDNVSIDLYVRKKAQSLVDELGVSVSKIGEVIRPSHQIDDHRQQTFNRGNRFLKGETKISVEQLVAVARFFGKPIAYFFPPSPDLNMTLASSTNQEKPSMELEVIRDNLLKLGFDEDFIKSEIRQLKMMRAYNAQHGIE